MKDYVTAAELRNKERSAGVAGIVRYFNDGFTAIPCLESIKGIFDEIIFAYQPHAPGFHRKVLEDIINGRVPELKGMNIVPVEYKYEPVVKFIPGVIRDPRCTLGNYYNTAISACSKEKFIKIDTDQIYFNSVLKKIIEENKVINKLTYPYGVNYILTDSGEEVAPAQAPFNGLVGDTLIVDFRMDPIFMQGPRWEYLKMGKLFDKRRATVPAWLHVTQPRRPDNFAKELRGPQKNALPSDLRNVPEHELKWVMQKAKEAVIAAKSHK